MGIKITTVTTCTCDICQAECSLEDRLIFIDVKKGCTTVNEIKGSLMYYASYGTSDGYICKQCKIRYLKQYIKELES